MTGGLVNCNVEGIGESSSAVFMQSGGVHTASTSLYLGGALGTAGSYNLSGGSLTVGKEQIGVSGTGSFTQSGGTHSVLTILEVGFYSSGSYTLDGNGVLTTQYASIGTNGSGSFIQSGGTCVVLSTLGVGDAESAHGSYSLSGSGMLAADSETIGKLAAAASSPKPVARIPLRTILASGEVATAAEAAHMPSVEAGLLAARNEHIATSEPGSFTQSGGTNVATNQISIGVNGGSYSLSGNGFLSSPTESIDGSFTQSGGTNPVSTEGRSRRRHRFQRVLFARRQRFADGSHGKRWPFGKRQLHPVGRNALGQRPVAAFRAGRRQRAQYNWPAACCKSAD